MQRNTSPLVLATLNKNEVIEVIQSASDKDIYRLYTNKETYDIEISDVPELTRLAQPKKTIPLPVGDNIIDAKLVGKK